MASTLLHLDLQRGSLGAVPAGADCARFTVWAPTPATMELHIVAPREQIIPLERDEDGIASVDVEGLSAGTQYFFRVNGRDRPDPASRYQPDGVHGPSEVVRITPEPTGGWTGLPLSAHIIYELHVGTFTPAGTLDAVIPELKRLKGLGITAIELMPISEFPGSRNWGYDGVFPYSVHHRYGGPEALRRLARACHQNGMALVLDIVYNHLGPEGNYLAEYGPYFTSHYRTPWGDAMNFDGPGSDHVRHYFIENALYWADCGVDALRLDAVHAIYDRSAYPFLRELSGHIHSHAEALGRRIHLIAESDLNDARLVLPPEQNGSGLDAQWSDDFHHCLHTLLTSERQGYYRDFGELEQFAETLRHGWLYSGQYSPSRGRRHGNSPAHVRGDQLIVCSQNHDQAGNRACGERLIHIAGYEAARLAATAVLLSPFIPLLFMGEEYGETAPFLYFVSHTDAALVEIVRNGRRREFPEMLSDSEFPDPQDERTFLRSKLDTSLLRDERHAALNRFYMELIRLRRTNPTLGHPTKSGTTVELFKAAETIVLRRSRAEQQAVVLFHLGHDPCRLPIYFSRANWSKVIDSEETKWGGNGTSLPAEICSRGSGIALSLKPLQAAAFINRVE